MADIRTRVKAYSENPTKTVVKARNFEIVIDEPQDFGGTDHGPTPVEFLLGALAGCLNVMSHIVAKEMGFELRGVEIDLSGDINPDRLFGKSYDERAGFKKINVRVKPHCDASKETLARWLQVVEERCPVSDNLMYETPVAITLKK